MNEGKLVDVRPWMVFGAALLVMFFRMPDRFLEGFLWAEDGPRMIQETVDLGRRNLFAVLPGYAVLLPKLIAYVTLKFLPVKFVAWAFVWTTAAVWAGFQTYVFTVFQRFDASPRGTLAALAIVLFPVLAPHAGEVFLNLANLQWLVFPPLAAALWSAFSEDEPKHPAWLGVLIFILTSTGPFGVLMAPFVVLLIVERRRIYAYRSRAGLVAAFAIPAAFQAFSMLRFGQKHAQPLVDLAWLSEYFTHVVADQFLTSRLSGMLPHPQVAGFLIFATLVICIMTTRTRWAAMSAIAFSTVVWVTAFAKVNDPDLHLFYDGNGSRYLYASSVAMFSAAALTWLEARHKSVRVVASVLSALILLTGLTTFVIPPQTAHWSYWTYGDTEMIIVPPAVPVDKMPWHATLHLGRDTP